jgi:hypothetical protein
MKKMMQDTAKRRINSKVLVYGANALYMPAANFINNNIHLGLNSGVANPAGAVFYSALDILGHFSPKIRNGKFSRLSKIAGAVWYGGKTATKAWGFAHGNYNLIWSLPFDISMAYQLMKDSVANYSNHSFAEDVKSVYNGGMNLADRAGTKIDDYMDKRIQKKTKEEQVQ